MLCRRHGETWIQPLHCLKYHLQDYTWQQDSCIWTPKCYKPIYVKTHTLARWLARSISFHHRWVRENYVELPQLTFIYKISAICLAILKFTLCIFCRSPKVEFTITHMQHNNIFSCATRSTSMRNNWKHKDEINKYLENFVNKPNHPRIFNDGWPTTIFMLYVFL